VDQSLANTFGTFSSGASQYHETVREFMLKIDAQLKDALMNLGSGVDGLTTGVEDLSEIMEKHAESMNEMFSE